MVSGGEDVDWEEGGMNAGTAGDENTMTAGHQ